MRLPLIPTLLVVIAAAIMVRLGVWQLHRADEKDALLARYAQNSNLPPIALPAGAAPEGPLLYRRAGAFCLQVVRWRQTGGHSAADMVGTRFLADCRTGAEGPGFVADMGVSADPRFRPAWTGGPVTGIIVAEPSSAGLWARMTHRAPPPRAMLVSDRPAPGLQPSAPPSPSAMPNNSWSYAMQWFFFAAAAMVIYLLALRRRRREVAGRAPSP